MGDRVSISFVEKCDGESVTLFSHWGGTEFAELAEKYIKELNSQIGTTKACYPLERREPNTVMVDFILWLHQNKEMERPMMSNYYLGKDGNDGDNSDNGHFKIDVKTGKKSGGRHQNEDPE